MVFFTAKNCLINNSAGCQPISQCLLAYRRPLIDNRSRTAGQLPEAQIKF